MRPTQHPSNNRVLGAPVGWDQAQATCHAVAVTDAVIDGVQCVMTYWQPTAAEIKMLRAGGSVALLIAGHSMPPVALHVIER